MLHLHSFVETKGRTLEEINEIFEAPYPKNKSIQKHIVVITDCGILDKGLEDCWKYTSLYQIGNEQIIEIENHISKAWQIYESLNALFFPFVLWPWFDILAHLVNPLLNAELGVGRICSFGSTLSARVY